MFLKGAVVYKCEVHLFSGGVSISFGFLCTGVQLNICVSFEAGTGPPPDPGLVYVLGRQQTGPDSFLLD